MPRGRNNDASAKISEHGRGNAFDLGPVKLADGAAIDLSNRFRMNEVQFLFPFEPSKPLKSRSLYVVFLVEKDMRVERCRTCDRLNHEEIDWQYEVCTRSDQKHRNEEEGCIVAFVTAVRP